jgi:hypothetical protein
VLPTLKPRSRRTVLAAMATVEVKVADVEPVSSLLDAMAKAVAEFVKISDEEKAALPEAARSGIGVLLGAAQDFMTHN